MKNMRLLTAFSNGSENKKRVLKEIISVIIICLMMFACKSQNKVTYETYDDGIVIEKFDSSNKDENRYTLDNQIYKTWKIFTFSYYYEDKSGIKYLMTKDTLSNNNNDKWKFEKADSKNPYSVSQIIMTVTYGLKPFIQSDTSYDQTVIKYDYKLNNGEFWNTEKTGLIENEKNIWMHPPRTGFFKILEINPFPYIKEPAVIGDKWKWELEFGDYWSDKRWLEWKSENDNLYNYEITQKLLLKTKIGDLDCYVINSVAESKLGKTKLVSYFNKVYGFVKLDYTNIDGTKIVIEIEKVQ